MATKCGRNISRAVSYASFLWGQHLLIRLLNTGGSLQSWSQHRGIFSSLFECYTEASNVPGQHLLPGHQAEKYSLEIIIYNWKKTILFALVGFWSLLTLQSAIFTHFPRKLDGLSKWSQIRLHWLHCCYWSWGLGNAGYCMELLRSYFLHSEMKICPSYWWCGPLVVGEEGQNSFLR